jgi:hypothetical protein
MSSKNSSGECSKCQLVSFASAEGCKRCGTVTKAGYARWLTPMWAGTAGFAVIGVTLWILALAPPKPTLHRGPVVDLSSSSHVVDEKFSSRAEQTEWLIETTSIEACQSLDRSVANPVPCETLPLQDQAMRNICRLKTMKAQNPIEWELTLKKLGAQPDPAPETVREIQ